VPYAPFGPDSASRFITTVLANAGLVLPLAGGVKAGIRAHADAPRNNASRR
jgi:hypothetical protein